MTTTLTPPTGSSEARRNGPYSTRTAHRGETLRRAVYLTGPLAFSVPFLALALVAGQGSFVPIEHGHAVLDAVLAHQRGALETLGQNASPLVAFIAYVFPSLAALRVVAALAAGGAIWVVWRQLNEVPLRPLMRVLLLTSFATTPALLFLSNAQASEMITLLLLLVAWRLYLRFVTEGITWNGFAAGLVLAIAFFTDFLSIAYVVPFAIAAPATLFRGANVTRDESFRAGVTGFLVIALPAFLAFAGWCYVNWVLKGNPFAFSSDAAPSSSLADGTSAATLAGWDRAWGALAGDMVRAPLYPLVGALILLRSPRTLAAYAFPLLLTTLTRAGGFAQGEAFTLGTYLGFALVGVINVVARRPVNLRRDRRSRAARVTTATFLVCAAVTQLTVNVTVSLRSTEATSWRHAVLDGRSDATTSQTERVSAALAALPDRSVLADDNAYEFIARQRTAEPYVLPRDARFELARSSPAEWVTHILVNDSPSAYDHLTQTFSGGVAGFYVDEAWPGWRLLTRDGTAPVLG